MERFEGLGLLLLVAFALVLVVIVCVLLREKVNTKLKARTIWPDGTELLLAVALMLIVGFAMRGHRPLDSAMVKAKEICGACGIEAGDVLDLAGYTTADQSDRSRSDRRELLRWNYRKQLDAELCDECADAILLAAGYGG